MSNRALNWAFDAPITGPAKSVLIALANDADSDNKSYPAISRLMRHAGLSERAVRSALRQLEATGAIRTEQKSGHRSTYFLVLNHAWTPACDAPHTPAPRAPLPGTTRPPLEAQTPAPQVFDPGTTCPQSLREPRKKERKSTPIVPKTAFDAFWKAYPRKVGRGAALKAWTKATAHADAALIHAVMASYPWPDDPQFIPHAATWLNQERWLDEPPKPVRKPTTNERIMQIFGIPEDDEQFPAQGRGLLQ